MENSKTLTLTAESLRDLCTIAANIALENAGVKKNEVTTNAARKRYGTFFNEMVTSGRIRPIRYAGGTKNTVRYWDDREIRAMMIEEREKARVIFSEI